MLSFIGVKLSTSASGSQPSGNTKKDKIQNYVVEPKGTVNVQHSKLNANSELLCVKCNGCMLSDNHDLCVLDFINDVNARAKSKSVKKSSKRKVWKPTGKVFTNIGYTWRPTGRTFTIVGNVCPLTRITTTAEVPLRKLTALESDTPKPVVTLVYSRKPRKSKTNVPVIQVVLWYLDSDCSKHMIGDRSHLTNFVNKFLGTVKFRNDHVGKILGYGDYQFGNVTISRVYYVEGLRHNLFFIGQLCDSNLEVAFRQHTCFIRNLEGVDLLTGSQGNNMYTLSLRDMMSSPICLLSKASKTKSWLWHQRLSHLNFGTISHLARHSLVRDNGTEFVNQTLREYYEKVGISHETSVARSLQQNGVVKRRNCTLIEAARTMLIYEKAPLFLWAEAVATACYNQNCSIIRLRHDITPYELLHDKLPDLSFFHIFGALCYPTNDSENLGKLQPKADIGIFIGYAPTKKAFQIYKTDCTRGNPLKTIHVDFDELTEWPSLHSSLVQSALHERTHAIIIQTWRSFAAIINMCLSGKNYCSRKSCACQWRYSFGACFIYMKLILSTCWGRLRIPKPKYVKNKADPESSPKKKSAKAYKGKRIKTSTKVTKPVKKKQPATTSKEKGLNVLSEISWMSSDEDDDDEVNVRLNRHDGDDLVHPKLSTFDEKERQDEEDKEEEWSDDEAYDDETQRVNVEGEELDEEETNEEDEVNELTGK
ncbi:integrase, catalytic region, zinc finger, CCHC-type containing protein [Tanacetum coccineum]